MLSSKGMSTNMLPKYHSACVSDLDGTLLPHQGLISAANLAVLDRLSASGVCRVLATGRSLYSLNQVIPPDAPFDYVIFATGAGIMDWQSKKLIYSQNLDGRQIILVRGILDELELNYMLHNAVPDTHHMLYRPCPGNPDFWNRVEIYREFATLIEDSATPLWEAATQFLVIVEQAQEALYQSLCERLCPLTAIRTTSPLDYSSMWIEIFAPGVDKGSGLCHLLELIGLSLTDVMVIGNDYNDLHMLHLGSNSFVTGNAPLDLQKQFQVVASCAEDGFAEAVELWLARFQH